MQRHLGALSVILLWGAAALAAQPVTDVFEPGGRLELKVYKTGLMSGKAHTFVFDRYHGTIRYDPETLENVSVQLIIESDSIRCLDDWVSEKDRRKILKEARESMLAVEKYPEIRFEASGLMLILHGEYSGKLTIRDQTRTVVVNVDYTPIYDAAPIQGSAVVSLEDFGIKPPSAMLGLIGTQSEMDFSFALLFTDAKE